MAKRHEDRKPGQRFRRSGGPSRGGPSRGGSSRGKPGPAGQRPRTGGSSRRKGGIVVTPSDVLGGGVAPQETDGKVRLNHFLAMSGVCSRRNADELIRTGRVEVNGALVTELGVRVDPANDDVRFDGSRVQPEKHVYVLLNKPSGVVCTNARHEQKKRVVDLLPTIRGRVFTVGRLDLDSEGLLLVTNDGAFAQEMTHPRYGVAKLYAVTVRDRVDEAALQKARGGVWLSEGPTGGMQLKVERVTKDRTFLKVALREGKNREIRRVFAKLGHPVLTLKRIRIGHLTLHGLGDGEWRFLQLHEVAQLREEAKRGASGESPDPMPKSTPRRGDGGARGAGPTRGPGGQRGSGTSRSGAGRPSGPAPRSRTGGPARRGSAGGARQRSRDNTRR